jgi:ribonuclease HI
VLTIFRDGSSNGKAAYEVRSHVHSLEFPRASAQITELCAVAAVFKILKNQAFNLYTDSQYIAHGLQLLEIVLSLSCFLKIL